MRHIPYPGYPKRPQQTTPPNTPISSSQASETLGLDVKNPHEGIQWETSVENLGIDHPPTGPNAGILSYREQPLQ